jgi:hypothetical protein
VGCIRCEVGFVLVLCNSELHAFILRLTGHSRGTLGVLKGCSGGTQGLSTHSSGPHRVPQAVLRRYRGGTQAVLPGYSRGTPGVLQRTLSAGFRPETADVMMMSNVARNQVRAFLRACVRACFLVCVGVCVCVCACACACVRFHTRPRVCARDPVSAATCKAPGGSVDPPREVSVKFRKFPQQSAKLRGGSVEKFPREVSVRFRRCGRAASACTSAPSSRRFSRRRGRSSAAETYGTSRTAQRKLTELLGRVFPYRKQTSKPPCSHTHAHKGTVRRGTTRR